VDAAISDGDLVRLARAGDPVAFRLLVERYRPIALARARSLCGDAGDVEDIVQDAFLQAFVALDKLQDPERFAAWLGGIIRNVYRAASRRAPLDLVAEWPEELHPVSADGLPEAAIDDLDRGDALGCALQRLPPRQQQAVRMFYYADLPVAGIASRLADTPGAVKARLHKARRRLRDHIAVGRPDLIPYLPRRTFMTTVRIAYAEPRSVGTRMTHVLVVLADDAGDRALPVWLKGFDGHSLRLLLNRPADGSEMAGVPEELADQVLRAAGITVTGVEIDELGPQVSVARIQLHGPTGTQHVTGRLGDGLALAVAHGAPIRVADTVMDRLAEPVQDGDLPGPFLDRVPFPTAYSGAHARGGPGRDPRNLAFADGLDGWDLHGTFLFHDSTGAHWDDYYAKAADDRCAVIGSAVPEPYGFAALSQAILADSYRGQTVTFRGELRARDIRDRAALYLRIGDEGAVRGPARPGANKQVLTPVGDSHDWTRREATAQVPDDAVFVMFGIVLHGQGQLELRNAELVGGRAQ
jgi:RNA polymerase sigma factor (sigma-70 family)